MLQVVRGKVYRVFLFLRFRQRVVRIYFFQFFLKFGCCVWRMFRDFVDKFRVYCEVVWIVRCILRESRIFIDFWRFFRLIAWVEGGARKFGIQIRCLNICRLFFMRRGIQKGKNDFDGVLCRALIDVFLFQKCCWFSVFLRFVNKVFGIRKYQIFFKCLKCAFGIIFGDVFRVY